MATSMAEGDAGGQTGASALARPGLSRDELDRDVPPDGARARGRRAMWILNRAGKIPFVISGQGHEGAQVGIASALRKGHDWMVPYYRSVAADHLRHEPARDHARPVRARRGPVVGRPADARPLRHRGPQHPVVSSPVGDADPPRDGHRLGGQAAQDRAGRDHLHRRGLVQPGRLPRGPQLRRHPQAAGDLRRREQRLRDLRARRSRQSRWRTSPSAAPATTCPA